MTLTLNQLYSQIELELGINSDDANFSRRFIYDLIINTRSIDLRNEYNRSRTMGQENLQVIPCIELELVDSSTCCGDLLTGCKVLRTVLPFPPTIEFHNREGIENIRLNNVLGKDIIYLDATRVPYVGSSTFANNMIFAFRWNEHLYIYSKNEKYQLVDSITVRGLFIDPVAAAKVGCNDNGSNCLTEEDSFPIATWIWESLTKPKIVQKLMGTQYLPIDNSNNAKDDINSGVGLKQK